MFCTKLNNLRCQSKITLLVSIGANSCGALVEGDDLLVFPIFVNFEHWRDAARNFNLRHEVKMSKCAFRAIARREAENMNDAHSPKIKWPCFALLM